MRNLKEAIVQQVWDQPCPNLYLSGWKLLHKHSEDGHHAHKDSVLELRIHFLGLPCSYIRRKALGELPEVLLQRFQVRGFELL